MKQVIQASRGEALLTHMTGIPYKVVPHWYGAAVRPLCLDLILPKAPERRRELPLLIWICGGAFANVDRNVWLPAMIDFARAGYAVASVDYRVSPIDPFPAPVQDVRAAVRYLRAHSAEYGLDPARFAAMGESAGGYLACMAGLSCPEHDVGEHLDQPSTVQAVIDIYGKVDYAMLGQDPCCNRQVLDDFLGDDRSEERLRRVSCKYLVDEHAAPTLILHGDRDDLVPIEESEGLYAALQARGVRSDFYVLRDAGHGDEAFYQPPVRRIILDFLAEVLA